MKLRLLLTAPLLALTIQLPGVSLPDSELLQQWRSYLSDVAETMFGRMEEEDRKNMFLYSMGAATQYCTYREYGFNDEEAASLVMNPEIERIEEGLSDQSDGIKHTIADIYHAGVLMGQDICKDGLTEASDQAN